MITKISRITVAIIITMVAVIALCSGAYAGYSVDIAGGTSVRAPVHMLVSIPGYETLSFQPEWAATPFDGDASYLVRLGRWKDKSAWELEFMHDEAVLTNPTDNVAKVDFDSINYFSINRAHDFGPFIGRIGLASVLTRSDVYVYGQDEAPGPIGGYSLSGVAAQVGVQKSKKIIGPLFFFLEGKATGTILAIPVGGGVLGVPSLGLHGFAGLRVAW